jgi:hypothetical protein
MRPEHCAIRESIASSSSRPSPLRGKPKSINREVAKGAKKIKEE